VTEIDGHEDRRAARLLREKIMRYIEQQALNGSELMIGRRVGRLWGPVPVKRGGTKEALNMP